LAISGGEDVEECAVESMESSVIDKLKQAIYAGELLPGEHLRQSELAKRFGVSRVPLREALLVLANIGLAEHTMNSGFRVAKRSPQDYEQLVWLVGQLETAIHQDLRPPTEAELAELEAVNREIASLSGAKNETPFTKLNHRFHSIIWGMSPKQLLVRQLENVWPLTEPFLGLVYTNAEFLERAVREHTEIIEALRANDPARLLQTMDTHRVSSTEAATVLRTGRQFMTA
jgi:DNA-binding GntR family transcriptional regulator